MKYISILIVTVFLALNAQAEFTKAKCTEALLGSGEIQVNRQWDVISRTCFIDIHPRNVVNMKYRDYYFSNKGDFMVFNSYGEGPDSEMTAAREFYIFPVAEEYPDFSIEENADVVVKLVSGHLFRISAKDFSIVSLTPGTFTEKPVSPNNKGGVEFKLQTGYWIDGGFQKGGSRLSNPKLKSVLKSAKTSKTCEIINNEFLNYEPDGNYVFKYENEKLAAFLKRKCPQISL